MFYSDRLRRRQSKLYLRHGICPGRAAMCGLPLDSNPSRQDRHPDVVEQVFEGSSAHSASDL